MFTELQTNSILEYKQKIHISDISEILKIIKTNKFELHTKLSLSIKYLNKIQDIHIPIIEYIRESKEILTALTAISEEKQLYQIWVRYFDITFKIKTNYSNNFDQLKNEITNLFTDLYVSKFSFKDFDWRLTKKILSTKTMFESDFIKKLNVDGIISSINNEINISLDFISKNNLSNKQLTINTLTKLGAYLSNYNLNKSIINSIIIGRLDKNEFDFEETIIIGEDGGIYMLLNNLTEKNNLIIKNEINEKYLFDKVNIKSKYDKKIEQITIGKGAFGTVRLGLNLTNLDLKPGKIICVKKTQNFEQIINKWSFAINPIGICTESILNDYFINDIAKIISSPKSLDLALIIDRNNPYHSKGYLMMEMFPHDNATRVFVSKPYQKWEYQKPYIVNILSLIYDLLKNNIFLTDFKPDNTLYDPYTQSTKIIDLGGSLTFKSASEIQNFDSNSHSLQITKEYEAPEFTKKSRSIDLSKSLSYTAGKVIEKIMSQNNFKKINSIISKLIIDDPKNRISILDALNKISNLNHNDATEKLFLPILLKEINKIYSVEKLKENEPSINSVRFLKNSDDIIVISNKTTITIWNFKTGEYLKALKGHTQEVNSIEFSDDLTLIVTTSNDKTIKVWDLKLAKCIQTLIGHTKEVSSSCFLGDNNILASCSADHTIKIWNIHEGIIFKTLYAHQNKISSIAFSKFYNVIITTSYDTKIKIWNKDNLECIKILSDHRSQINSVTLSSDQTIFVTSSNDHNIKVWNINHDHCIKTLYGHTDLVYSCSFLKNSKFIVSSSRDGKIKFWNINSGKCLTNIPISAQGDNLYKEFLALEPIKYNEVQVNIEEIKELKNPCFFNDEY